MTLEERIADNQRKQAERAAREAAAKPAQATAADVRWLAGVQRVVGQGRNKHWLVPLR